MERVSPGVRSRSGDQRHFEGITLLINEADLPEGWELAGRFSAFGVLQDFWFFFPMQPIVLADL